MVVTQYSRSPYCIDITQKNVCILRTPVHRVTAVHSDFDLKHSFLRPDSDVELCILIHLLRNKSQNLNLVKMFVLS